MYGQQAENRSARSVDMALSGRPDPTQPQQQRHFQQVVEAMKVLEQEVDLFESFVRYLSGEDNPPPAPSGAGPEPKLSFVAVWVDLPPRLRIAASRVHALCCRMDETLGV